MNQKKKFKKILLFALMFLLPLMSSISSKTIGNNNYRNNDVSIVDTKNSIREDLIKEVRTYIKPLYAKCPEEIITSIVDAGL